VTPLSANNTECQLYTDTAQKGYTYTHKNTQSKGRKTKALAF